jgi:RHH-type proline utilization regulon transcriptional repressor/proline dehydrogenase/delta 1-pyrroline-5-carboxylate dehydrogenase
LIVSDEELAMTHAQPFKNEALLDFGEASSRKAVLSGLEEVQRLIEKGALYARPIIHGEEVRGSDTYTRTDPSDHTKTIGVVEFGDVKVAERAVATCAEGLRTWRSTSAEHRARILNSIAALFRERKSLLTGIMIREVGKTWREADADVAEAIDFCDYYAAEIRRLGRPHLTQQVMGEENHYLYQPRGVTVVISPWNFPLAIACGMAVAALAAGNTVVLKPAEQSSLIAHQLARIILEAGVPADAFSFVPGKGEEVGPYLVKHPLVAMIVFTGSRAVGLHIVETAAKVSGGQRMIKKVVAELGGKNAIIVDEDADFDDAIRGVLSSAFGYAGQKCSACSRLIVVGSAYEPFIQRLAAATADIIVGSASDPSSFLGPVVDQEAFERITKTIASASNLTLLAQAKVPAELARRGNYVAPTIFRDVPTTHPIWTEEIFGPVVACAQARDFEHALQLATASEYALTGGVFSRHPQNLERAKDEFRVGNLYINRGITGALVERQPFGGFLMSGIGSKAGGPDYLLQFMEPRVITENTMRRGFSPDIA